MEGGEEVGKMYFNKVFCRLTYPPPPPTPPTPQHTNCSLIAYNIACEQRRNKKVSLCSSLGHVESLGPSKFERVKELRKWAFFHDNSVSFK